LTVDSRTFCLGKALSDSKHLDFASFQDKRKGQDREFVAAIDELVEELNKLHRSINKFALM
jgi:hypothetical protein